jgi:hypothetical protein
LAPVVIFVFSVAKPKHRQWAWVDEHVGVVAANRVACLGTGMFQEPAPAL